MLNSFFHLPTHHLTSLPALAHPAHLSSVLTRSARSPRGQSPIQTSPLAPRPKKSDGSASFRRRAWKRALCGPIGDASLFCRPANQPKRAQPPMVQALAGVSSDSSCQKCHTPLAHSSIRVFSSLSINWLSPIDG